MIPSAYVHDEYDTTAIPSTYQQIAPISQGPERSHDMRTRDYVIHDDDDRESKVKYVQIQ